MFRIRLLRKAMLSSSNLVLIRAFDSSVCIIRRILEILGIRRRRLRSVLGRMCGLGVVSI